MVVKYPYVLDVYRYDDTNNELSVVKISDFGLAKRGNGQEHFLLEDNLPNH